MDENIFDEDEALDYILYEESENDIKNRQPRAGCLATLLILLAPFYLQYII